MEEIGRRRARLETKDLLGEKMEGEGIAEEIESESMAIDCEGDKGGSVGARAEREEMIGFWRRRKYLGRKETRTKPGPPLLKSRGPYLNWAL